MPSRPLIYKYPLDLTGINPNNLVMAEPHTLPDGVNRAIVPNYGAFFADSLVVRDTVSGNVLIPREQFKAAQLYQEATTKTGKEVCAVVVIVDETVSSEIEITYQAIGGEFSYSVIALRDMLDTLDLDERPVRWGDILGTPSAFPPAPHLHDAGDLYGFEYLTEALDYIRNAILSGGEVDIDELKQHIELRALAEHVTQVGAHDLTKYDVGLSQLQDIKPAVVDGVANDLDTYITNLMANAVIEDVALPQP